ncbi:YfiR family protein [Musicola keenii]|uniref:YfiR family protein n=1 Tax=Musicola keenii TaxID=2884250 RepID=UPI00177FEBE0|nr:YfiR family protein [Musicola keenii]
MIKKRTLFVALITALTLNFSWAHTPDLQDDLAQVAASDVRRTVSGIISYSRWPIFHNKKPLLCVFASSHFLSALITPPYMQEKAVFEAIKVENSEEFLSSGCDVVYFGEENEAQQMAIINRVQGQPLLTISEQSPRCLGGSSFCLIFADKRVSFSINMDALVRTGVRVNPDVLILAKTRDEHCE